MGETNLSEVIGSLKRDYLENLLNQGKRLNGRGFLDYRDVKIEKGVFKHAAGSSVVSIGDTKIAVGIKADVGAPYSDTPDRGVMTTSVELVPLAAPDFESGPPNENSIELARVVDRSIRESECIDLASLVIEEGKLVRILFIDIHVLDHSGNLIDAANLATIAALLDTKLPKLKVENGTVETLDEFEDLKLRNLPVEVTICKLGNHYLLDPDLDEESAMDCRLTIATDDDGDIRAMQKGLGGTLKSSELQKLYQIAKEQAQKLRKLLK